LAAEGIIAALIGAVAGGGGVRALSGLVGPERDTQIAEYYRKVIRALYEENEHLRGRMATMEERIEQLELNQDAPPPHLG
jgi:hypothetical protein